MDEESLKRSVRAFVAQFEPTIIAIHTMAVEIRLGAFDGARAQRVIAVGAEALSGANALIATYLSIHSTDRELQDLFVQLLVSLQPRLAGELGELRAALESDPEPIDADILDRDPASAPPGAGLVSEIAAERDRLGRANQTGKLDDFLPGSPPDHEREHPGDAEPAAPSVDPDDAPRAEPPPSVGPQPHSDGARDSPRDASPGSGGTVRADAANGDEEDRANADRSGSPEEVELERADEELAAVVQDGNEA